MAHWSDDGRDPRQDRQREDLCTADCSRSERRDTEEVHSGSDIHHVEMHPGGHGNLVVVATWWSFSSNIIILLQCTLLQKYVYIIINVPYITLYEHTLTHTHTHTLTHTH